MKLKDILLVTNGDKGAGCRYLAGIEDHVAVLFREFEVSGEKLAHAVKELCQTKDNSFWTEVDLSSGRSIHARFCSSEQELRSFLMGNHGMAGEETAFDKDSCTKECLDALTAHNMDCGGHPLIGKLHYERHEHSFRQGETLHNLNGSDYSVLMMLGRNDLLLMALGSGQFLIAEGTREYARYPKEGTYTEDSIIRGIEWDRGIYLGNDLSAIDIESIRTEYALNRGEGQGENGADDELER